jgi:hypothetical protein
LFVLLGRESTCLPPLSSSLRKDDIHIGNHMCVCVCACCTPHISNASITHALLPVGLLFTPPVCMCVCVCFYVCKYVKEKMHRQSFSVASHTTTITHTDTQTHTETPTLT